MTRSAAAYASSIASTYGPTTYGPSGREVGRRRDVPAEADDHLGVDPRDRLARRGDRGDQPRRQPDDVEAEPARQRHPRHLVQLVATRGHQPRLEPGRGAEREDARA